MNNLPEIMPPKDVGFAFSLIDSNSNSINLSILTNFRINVITNTLHKVGYWSKNVVPITETQLKTFVQFTRISDILYYGFIPSLKSKDCKGQTVIFQFIGQMPSGEIISDEIPAFVFLYPTVENDLIELPANPVSGLSMIDILITFRSDRKVDAITPTQPINAVFAHGKFAITTAGYDVIWVNSLGNLAEDYILKPFFYNETGYKGFVISNRTKNGFHIVPDEDGTFEYVAELIAGISEYSSQDIRADIVDITTVGYDVVFDEALGLDGNYMLEVFFYNETGYKGFVISNRTKDGFHVVPDEDGKLEYKATLL